MPPSFADLHQPPIAVPAIQTSENLVRTFIDPPGKVYVLHGDRAIFTLSLTMASAALSNGASMAVVDGGNRFNVHLISRFARERRLDPAQLLNRIFISRGFTCYQMEQAVTRRLPAFLASKRSTIAMIFDPLETLYDEQAPLREVRQILRRMLIALHDMKRRGISLLIASTDRTVWPEERNTLFPTLATAADRVYRLVQDEQQRPIIQPDNPPYHPIISKGDTRHGPHRTDLHKHHRQ